MSQSPWWFTILMMVLSAGFGHLLTIQRESGKNARDWMDKWEKAFSDQARKIADMSTRHYIAADSVQNTPISSALILNELKRLQGMLSETTCLKGENSARTQKAFRFFHETISQELDFQDPSRTVRPHNDPVVGRIMTAEQDLLTEARQGRVKKPR